MDSPLARVILATLGGYLIILLFLSVCDWITEEYPRRPTKQTKSERIQHPFYHEKAAKALQRFSQLTKSEKTAFQENLQFNLITIEQWLTHLDQSNYQIMCIGEFHEESTRNFLAENFFAKFRTDVLLLEATPVTLRHLIKRMDAGRDYFPLLDADIMKILRTVKHKSPAIKIWGIEETDEQEKGQRGHSVSRDQSIAAQPYRASIRQNDFDLAPFYGHIRHLLGTVRTPRVCGCPHRLNSVHKDLATAG